MNDMAALTNLYSQVAGLNAYACFAILISLNLIISVSLAVKKKEFKGEKLAEFVQPLVSYFFLVTLVGIAGVSAQNDIVSSTAISGIKATAYIAIIYKYIKQTFAKFKELYALLFKCPEDDTFDNIIDDTDESDDNIYGKKDK